MRRVWGEVVLPQDAPVADRGDVLVEVRDVSLMDVPSELVAEWRRQGLPIRPGARIPFELEVPEREPHVSLSLRAHVSLDGSGIVKRGDPMSVQLVPVPPSGDAGPIEVPTRII